MRQPQSQVALGVRGEGGRVRQPAPLSSWPPSPWPHPHSAWRRRRRAHGQRARGIDRSTWQRRRRERVQRVSGVRSDQGALSSGQGGTHDAAGRRAFPDRSTSRSRRFVSSTCHKDAAPCSVSALCANDSAWSEKSVASRALSASASDVGAHGQPPLPTCTQTGRQAGRCPAPLSPTLHQRSWAA